MSDVFISYAREDREKAESLARAFEEQKWTIWWDKVIPPGKKYADAIGEELASAKAVIVLWSQASVASDWVKDEAQEGANRRILVPVLIEKVSPPFGFRQVQTADLSEWDGSSSDAELQGLVRGIGSLLNKPVSASTTSNARTDSGKRRQLYLLAGVVLIVLLLSVAYRFIPTGGTDPNQNRSAGENNGGSNQNSSSAPRCDSASRQKAAEMTGKGLLMIDPGGNYNAATLQFKEAILACPDYSDAYFWRGQSYVALQQNKNAVADFKKVVEITTDEDTRQQAQKFIVDIETPAAIPTPTANTNTSTNTNANTGGSNTNANTSGSNTNTNTGSSNTNQGSVPVVQADVKEMFDVDPKKRILATNRMKLVKKNDARFVGLTIEAALKDPKNESGVINALAYLETVDPEILKKHRREIEKLFAVAKDNGEKTAVHIKKVERLLNQ